MVLVFVSVAIWVLFSRLRVWFIRLMPVAFVVTVLLQLVLLLSTDLMIRSDAAMVFNGAMNLVNKAVISQYLTENTNNLALFLYERSFYHLFGAKAIWVLQAINMLFVDSAAIGLYLVEKRFFNQRTAVLSYYSYLVLLAATPQFLAMYTDIMALPLIMWQLLLTLSLLLKKKSRIDVILSQSLLLGILSGLAFYIRPPLLVLIIAFFLILLVYGKFKLLGQVIVGFGIGFSLLVVSLQYTQSHQKEVAIQSGQSKTLLSFIDLGLTSTGTDQADFQAGLAGFVTPKMDGSYDGRYDKSVVLKDIKRRLAAYNSSTFTDHLLLKGRLTLQDGTLGWTYKDASLEGAFYQNPLYKRFKDIPLAVWVRNHLIYTDQEEFQFSRDYLQMTWLFLILGLVLFSLFPTTFGMKEHFLILSLLGGLLFLMIFEGGKTRYLIQFSPQIFLLSALGFQSFLNLIENNRSSKRFVVSFKDKLMKHYKS
ncbi:glycosyltransferase family 39 protein [Streptococcus saliviloxodontae]|uniref:Integral membrane protein (TIGR03766 family) n=1 Tax=Streptococcus saliviloxodontae TaxID=1349416 RepID=A0ABS2PL18_9STRE|nr:integral membrane protein (TIGR03766 family) [Streptococcus saliviloxodontae]